MFSSSLKRLDRRDLNVLNSFHGRKTLLGGWSELQRGGITLSRIIKYGMVVSYFLISNEARTRGNRLKRGS